MWRELQAASQGDLRVPEVVAERCVHARVASASCRACVDACPRQAWIIDEDMLGIDTEKCDGCDLCVPACPQGAIERRFFPSLKAFGRIGVAFAACEHAGVGSKREGLMPCLHALGMSDFLHLRREGARVFFTSCGDCSNCERGGVKGFEQWLEETNRLLRSRGQALIEFRSLDAGAWTKAVCGLGDLKDLRVLDRRAFFRNVLEHPKELLDEVIEDAGDSYAPPGMLLDGDAADALFPYVPTIDPEGCNGCDACVRLCPQEAVRLDTEERDVPTFLIQAERCSGCGICTDVCDQDAVTIASLACLQRDRIQLRTGKCSACGNSFHIPAVGEDQEHLCWICRTRNRYSGLYQVLG